MIVMVGLLFEYDKQILNQILQKTVEFLGAESGSLFLFDKERQELVLNTILDKGKDNLKGSRKRLGEGIVGRVAVSGEAILVRDIKTDRRFNNNGDTGQSKRHYLTDSFISVPLITCYGLVGVMNITDKKSAEPFNQKDFDFVCLLAKLTSLMMEYEMKLRVSEAQVKENNNFNKSNLSENNQKEIERFAFIGKQAGEIVHEINGPLDGILRYANILLEKPELNSNLKDYLLKIKLGLVKISNIIDSVKRLYSPSKITREDDFVDINQLIDQELSLIDVRFPQSLIKIERYYQKDIPRVVDYGLSRVFSNIITNAYEAMSNNGLLRICTSSDEQNIKIIFTDTGCGMSPVVKAKAFDAFFTTKSKDKAMGLGLSICQEIIRRYSGNIEIQSQINQGTIVTIVIPKLKEVLKSR